MTDSADEKPIYVIADKSDPVSFVNAMREAGGLPPVEDDETKDS